MSRQLFLRLPFVEQKDSFRLASVSEDTGDLLEALETLIPADSRFFWTVSGLRTPLGHGLSLLDVCGHDNEAFPLNLTLHPRVLGGKGGFGTQLKSQAGRMSRKRRGEKANLGSCRDLSGRRLRTLDEAQHLATFIAKEAERQQARADAKDVKIKKGLEGRPRPKARFDDTKYLDDHEAALESVGDAVLQALLTKKSPVVSSSTAPSKDAQDPKGKGKRKLDSVDAPVTKPNVKNIKATSAATSSTAYAWADNLSDAIVESSSEEE